MRQQRFGQLVYVIRRALPGTPRLARCLPPMTVLITVLILRAAWPMMKSPLSILTVLSLVKITVGRIAGAIMWQTLVLVLLMTTALLHNLQRLRLYLTPRRSVLPF